MSIKTITQPTFVVDLESEKSTSWPIDSLVWVKETNTLYSLILVGVTAAIIASAVFFTKINFNPLQQTIVEVQTK